MIITEEYMTREDGVVLERRYSDSKVLIENTVTGERFSEAVDPVWSGRKYRETDITIEETDDT